MGESTIYEKHKMTPVDVLIRLCRYSERLIPDLPTQRANKLRALTCDMRMSVNSIGLSTNEVCNQIEDLYHAVAAVLKQHPKLARANPLLVQTIDQAKEFVMTTTGCIHYPDGKIIGSPNCLDGGPSEFLRRKRP
jgi:uncharacterized protein Usg